MESNEHLAYPQGPDLGTHEGRARVASRSLPDRTSHSRALCNHYDHAGKVVIPSDVARAVARAVTAKLRRPKMRYTIVGQTSPTTQSELSRLLARHMEAHEPSTSWRPVERLDDRHSLEAPA